jgi:hypothetical protein
MEAGPDLDRLLAGGSWLIAAPKARTKKAAEMRALRRARRAEGWSSFTLWVAPEQLAAIKAALRPGESYVELLVRLIEEQRSLL